MMNERQLAVHSSFVVHRSALTLGVADEEVEPLGGRRVGRC
jgi:hypothetical protein